MCVCVCVCVCVCARRRDKGSVDRRASGGGTPLGPPNVKQKKSFWFHIQFTHLTTAVAQRSVLGNGAPAVALNLKTKPVMRIISPDLVQRQSKQPRGRSLCCRGLQTGYDHRLRCGFAQYQFRIESFCLARG